VFAHSLVGIFCQCGQTDRSIDRPPPDQLRLNSKRKSKDVTSAALLVYVQGEGGGGEGRRGGGEGEGG